MESPSFSAAPISASDQDAVVAPAAAQVRTWLSLYGACCTEERVEMHPGVLSRVLQAVELAQSRGRLSSESDGTPAATATRHASRSGEDDAEAATAMPSPMPYCDADAGKGSTRVAGLSVDFGGLWMPLSEWIATLRSVVAAVPLHNFSLRDTALGDAGLRCLCREVATTSITPASVGTPSRCEGGIARLPGLSPLPAPSFYPHPSPGLEATSALRWLDLSGAELTDGGPLALLLASCPQLHALNLSYNRLGTRDAGLALLCAALQLHPSLEVLSLRRNGISGSRGGPAIAALAELIVARSVEAPLSFSRANGPASAFCGQHAATTTAVVARSLRSLDLSDNLLGAYFLLSDTPMTHCAEEGRLAAALQYDVASLSGCHVGVHEGVAAFPLVTALCLNNTLVELNLRDNGLPDALLEYVEAKLRVNRRTTGGGASFLAAASTEAIASTTVRQVLFDQLRCTLNHIHAETTNASGVMESTHAEPRDAQLTEGSPANSSSGPPVTERRWTTDEVVGLVQRLVRRVASDLSLC
ncbi:putative Leucine Rich repeat [Leishmania utingensis]|uniref:Leucine Rich repeat n=1 Tax=Leishmania utingensis TaxID=653362 RepID=A0AAW3ARN2_9TRYP